MFNLLTYCAAEHRPIATSCNFPVNDGDNMAFLRSPAWWPQGVGGWKLVLISPFVKNCWAIRRPIPDAVRSSKPWSFRNNYRAISVWTVTTWHSCLIKQ